MNWHSTSHLGKVVVGLGQREGDHWPGGLVEESGYNGGKSSRNSGFILERVDIAAVMLIKMVLGLG